MSQALYDIWRFESHDPKILPWHLQLYGYIAHFESREKAEAYAETVKVNRKKEGLDESILCKPAPEKTLAKRTK